MKNQQEQFQFEIHVLGKKIRELKLEEKSSIQGQIHRSESVERFIQGQAHTFELI